MPESAARCRIPSTDPRVVAGAYRVETEGQRLVEHRRELDLLVTAQARVRGAARGVLGDEILHYVAMESLGHVPDIERDPDDVGGPPGVPGVLQRAAAPGTGPVGGRVTGQRQMDAGHLVTRVHGTSRGCGGVHSARHRREHSQTSHRPSRLRARNRCRRQQSPRSRGSLDTHSSHSIAAIHWNKLIFASDEQAQVGSEPIMAGPLYRQIADQLRHLIESGELKGGMQIPTEDQLMMKFHTSRNTVRGALRELTTRGLVYTLHGKGTFVSEPVAPIVITLTSDPETGRGGGEGLVYTAEVAASGRKPEFGHLEVGIRRPTRRLPAPCKSRRGRGHLPARERIRGRAAMVAADLVLPTESRSARPAPARPGRYR